MIVKVLGKVFIVSKNLVVEPTKLLDIDIPMVELVRGWRFVERAMLMTYDI